MPGMDYLYEGQRRENFWTDHLFLEMGLGIGGEVGGRQIQKYGRKRLSSSLRGQRTELYDYIKSKRPGGVALSPGAVKDVRDARARIGKVKDSPAHITHRNTISLGKKLKTAGRFIGFMGLGIAGYELGKSAAGVGESFRRRKEEMNELNVYEPEFLDSGTAFTQRQRALQVIHNSQLSTRAALGNEARYLHY